MCDQCRGFFEENFPKKDESDKPEDTRPFIQNTVRYLKDAFGPIENIEAIMRKYVNPDKFDTLVGTGLSGALVIPRLADMLGKKWAIVRKSDNSHSNNSIEGEIGRKWLFLDDTVDTGETRNRVISVVRRIARSHDFSTEFVGTYLYYDKKYEPA